MKEKRKVGKYETRILEMLSDEPRTPNEIANLLNIHQRTAQVALMQLALQQPDLVKYKQIGRTHLFWKRK